MQTPPQNTGNQNNIIFNVKCNTTMSVECINVRISNRIFSKILVVQIVAAKRIFVTFKLHDRILLNHVLYSFSSGNCNEN